jgi:hypothetical protein
MTLTVHTSRYSTTGVVARKLGVVVHDSESGDGSFQALLNVLQSPGLRPIEGTTRTYGSAYHAITDGLGGYLQVLPATAGPYAAPPTNKTWWHVCIPGFARQTTAEWDDDISRKHIKGVARFIVDKAAIDGYPLVRRTPVGLVARQHGYCGHIDVTNAWHQTDHTDPGPQFPWATLAAEIEALVQPPTPGDDMAKLFKADDGDNAVFAVSGLEAVWCVSRKQIQIGQQMGTIEGSGGVGETSVPRSWFKALTLVGQVPSYDGVTPPPAVTTVAEHFAQHVNVS